MGLCFRPVVVGTILLSTVSACTLHETYPPALPASRIPFDNSPLVAVTPPPPALAWVALPPPPIPESVPAPAEWDLWRRQPPPSRRRPRGPKGRTVTAALALEEPQAGAPVSSQGGLIVRYPYAKDRIYDIKTSPQSATHLFLPQGERLAATPAINTDEKAYGAYAVGPAELGSGPEREEVLALRPLQVWQPSTTAFLFRSGLKIFARLIPVATGSMLSVSFDVPKAPAPPKEVPIDQRPPKIDIGRLYTAYSIQVKSKHTPPWVPVAVFDDGTRTYVRFAEALTYTRRPGLFGLTPTGETAMVQSQMYTKPEQPEAGAMLVTGGLWSALKLQDSTGAVVLLVRQPPAGGGATHAAAR